MNKLRLRLIYAAHMLVPLSLMHLHLATLDEPTLVGLRSLFQP